MAGKKGGARASKFLKTMSRGSQVSQQEPAPEMGEEQKTADGSGVEEGVPGREPPGTQQRQAARRTGGGVGGRSKRRARPEKPVRITVDLDAERHQFLRDYAYRQDAKGTAVVRALLDELREDPGLSERVDGRLGAG